MVLFSGHNMDIIILTHSSEYLHKTCRIRPINVLPCSEGRGLTRPHPETCGQFMVAGEKKGVVFIGVVTGKVAVLL